MGAPITSRDGAPALIGLLGIHLNLPATVPPSGAALGGGPARRDLSRGTRRFAIVMTNARGNSPTSDDDAAAGRSGMADGLPAGSRGDSRASGLCSDVRRRFPKSPDESECWTTSPLL